MANQANVEALTVLLFQEQGAKPNDHVTYEQLRGTGFEVLAQRLARRGVLVISDAVLTDEHVLAMCHDYDYDTPVFREKLARLARGEETE